MLGAADAAAVERTLLDDLPARFNPGHVAPENLARLVVFDLLLARGSGAFHAALMERLLDLTVRMAVEHSPFHAQRLDGLDTTRPVGQAAMPRLPVLRRAELEAAGTAVRSREATYLFSTYTSGTTSGRPLVIDRAVEEQAYLDAFFGELRPEDAASPSTVALVLDTGFHGRNVTVPSPLLRLPVSATNLHGLATAETLLDREFPLPRGPVPISTVGGHLTSLLRLTAFLRARHEPGHFAHVTAVQSSSEYMSAAARRAVQEFWQAPVEDRWGLSEMLCGAWRCDDCGLYHFEPYGFPEVLDLETQQPLEQGRGELVVTGFYPFSQMTYFVRYETGDLVDLVPRACEGGQSGYRLLGRKDRALRIGADGDLLADVEIVEVLDSEPGVRRRSLPNPFLPDELANVGTGPDYAAEQVAPAAALLRVGVSFDPDARTGQAESLRAGITSKLAAANAAVAPAHARGELCVELHGGLDARALNPVSGVTS